MQRSIYVIEDDKNIAELIEIALKSYSYETYTFERAEDALKSIKTNVPSVIVLDIMLPGINGIEAVSIIRKDAATKRIPIILLTAKDSEADKIKGLDCGADDYMTKPFSIMELMARIRLQFRKLDQLNEAEKSPNSNNSETTEIAICDLKINKLSREVFIRDTLIELTYKEYELLKYLVENNNKAISREEILNQVWGYEYAGETRTVDIHIKTLRKKVLDVGQYIKTVRGVGYKFSVNR